jgi:GrpB-like predicted nucleotidyltransferase (UPF0157 family)
MYLARVAGLIEVRMDRFVIQDLPEALLAYERDRVVGLLRATVPGVDVSEVGSTAVDGAIGKGDLDFLVRPSGSEFVQVRAALDRVLARNPHQLSNEIYQGYTVESALDVAVQLTVAGGPYDNFHAFIEALRSSAELLGAYNALKRRWHGLSMEEYRLAKGLFVEAALAGRAKRQP